MKNVGDSIETDVTLNPCPVPWCTGVGQLAENTQFNFCYIYCPICRVRAGTASSPVEAAEKWNQPKGYTCFHCQEYFSTIGSARDHFGGDSGSLAGCQIKVGEERGLLMALRKAEAANDEWRKEALAGRSSAYSRS